MKHSILLLLFTLLVSNKFSDREDVLIQNCPCYTKEGSIVKFAHTDIYGAAHADIIINAAPEHFTVLTEDIPAIEACSNTDVFAKDKMGVYYKSTLLRGMNPEKFRLLEQGFSKDDKLVFFRDTILNNAHAESFEVLNYFYAKDKNNIWYKNKIVKAFKKIDPASFKLIDSNFGKDSQSVYILNRNEAYPMSKIKTKTFRLLNDKHQPLTVYADKFNIYCYRPDDTLYSIAADIQSFSPCGSTFFSCDKNSVYYRDKKVYGANAGTFKPLARGYGMDTEHIFFKNNVLLKADVHTFVVYKDNEDYDASDKNYLYLQGRRFRRERD